MGSGTSTAGQEPAAICEALFTKAAEVLGRQAGNRCAKYLCDTSVQEAVKALDAEKLNTFVACVRTGLVNEDSGLGCYAMKPDDYSDFGFYFDKVIGDYHKGDAAFAGDHETDWALPEGAVFDLKSLGLEKELSMRVRVGRNLSSFPLPGAMTKDDRIKFEKVMLKSFEEVKKTFGGEVYSMTPDFNLDGAEEANPNLISAEKYDELVKAHVMFKDMDADPFLKEAGISSNWPYGRGCWQSAEKDKIIWFGEEDQLRIMCMKKGFLLNEVFDGLKSLLDCIESVEGVEFAKHKRFGYVTSCPSNLGTGMRASVHIQLSNLTSDDDGHGTSLATKAVASPLGLSVRGTGGEHTPIVDGTVDISPQSRLFIKENEIIGKLLEGLSKLLEAEKAATPAAAAAE